ncbi:homeobox-leucine zipper HDG1-like isoform X3 [Olea europaea subsp. europaea]|uniref:Homeobox-leucine zipper HDG1-like isoform X3 n=1 Tax=Olea europaea subsp. europaea TaxID=158383 RepID=A0A8S0RVE0_OLEEU|nr:homeobox-leucine zipper HDG1-like isoform X3 [Olea europaea subsp. europaea]
MKLKMENFGERGFMCFDSGRAREDESRYGNDNLENVLGDDRETPGNGSSKRKKQNRHTPFQIQELENSFKENPHPDEKARQLVGRRLGLEERQVKFWFQNRRTQMKFQVEHYEHTILKQENEKLRIENIAMKDVIRNPICPKCGGLALLGKKHMEHHHLILENARLRDELNQLGVLENNFMSWPLPSLANPMPPIMGYSGLDLALGRNSFGSLNSIDPELPTGLDFGNWVTSVDVPFNKSMFQDLALAAMDELIKLAQLDSPLWFRNLDGSQTLNLKEYASTISPCLGMKPDHFVTEATKATGTVIINSVALAETLMNTNQWMEMFPYIIGRASTVDVISAGTGGNRNGALQLMHAEFQVLSPLVPVRQVKFIRFCKQNAKDIWAVVDVSVDAIQEGSRAHVDCRRLPSGCVIQDLPNGYSKVTWVEHTEYDANVVHQLYQPLLNSGLGFGAQKWVASLQRQCNYLAAITSSTIHSGDHAVTNPAARRSIGQLAQRMTRSFCNSVCATVHKWELVQSGNADNTKLMMRESIGNRGEPLGTVLSAVTTVWLPISCHYLFDFLRNEQTRGHWDVLSQDGCVQQMLHIPKSQDLVNSISVLRNSAAASANQISMLILQETCMDVSGSLVVHAAVNSEAMNLVMSRGDPSCVALLPSGFAIFPDCSPVSDGHINYNRGSDEGNSGSLLTIGFQILVNSSPAAKLTTESIDTVNSLIARTLQGIKVGLQCN